MEASEGQTRSQVAPPSNGVRPNTPIAPSVPPHPLDGEWHLDADGQIYGPYTGHKIKEFVGEGRVTPGTRVLRPGSGTWVPASDVPVLGALFLPPPVFQPPQAGQVSAAQGATVVQVVNNLSPRPAVLLDDGGPAKPKSAGTAFLLSFILPGVGQMYNGQVAKGILTLFSVVFFFGLSQGWIFLGLIIMIWAWVDAYKTAKAMNLRYQRRLAAGYAV